MTNDPKSLPFNAAREIDLVCDQFEALLQAGKEPKIEDFLAESKVDNREDLLRALLQVEVELLGRSGKLDSLQSYQSRFPQQNEIVEDVYQVFSVRPGASSESIKTRISPSPNRRETVSVRNASVESSRTGHHVQQGEQQDQEIQTFGKFEIRKVLGKGGFGTVYHGYDPQLERDVAIKVPHRSSLDTQELRDRFLREARATATLRHPNICPVYEIGELDGQPYIVMAFIEGLPLTSFINPDRPLSERQIANIIRRVATALDTAHESNIIHRDLKPDNIMIDRATKQPVVMDFGLARRDQSQDTHLTQEGQIMGTPVYMPPEQAIGKVDKIGHRSDIYSLGVILYEMLAFERPFQGSVAEVLAAIVRDEPEPPSSHREGLNPRIESICMQAMSKEPEDRFQSMAEFAKALTDFIRDSGTNEERPEVAPIGKNNSSSDETNEAGLTAFFGIGKPENAVDKYLSRKNQGLWWSRRSSIQKISIGLVALVLLAVLSVIFFRTEHGTVEIEILDPTLQVSFGKDTFTIDNDGKPIQVTPGKHSLLVSYEGLNAPIEKTFEVTRNDTTALRVTRVGEEVRLLRADDELLVDTQKPRFELLRTFKADPETVFETQFQDGGDLIATGSKKSTVKLWDVDTGDYVEEFASDPQAVMAFAFSEGRKQVAIGSWWGKVRILDTNSKQELWSTDVPFTPTAIRFRSDDLIYIAGGAHGMTEGHRRGPSFRGNPEHYEEMIQRMESRGAPKQHIDMMKSRLAQMKQQDVGKTEDAMLQIWDWHDNKEIADDSINVPRLYDMRFSPDGTTFATCGQDGEFTIREIVSGKVIESIKVTDSHPDHFKSLAYSNDGRFLAASHEGGFVVYDTRAKQVIYRQESPTGIWPIKFAPNTHILFTGHDDNGGVQVWNVDQQQQIGSVPEDEFSVSYSMDISSDGRRLAIRKSEGRVSIWNVILPENATLVPDTAVVEVSSPSSTAETDYDSLATGEWISVPLNDELLQGVESGRINGNTLQLDDSATAFIPGVQAQDFLLRAKVKYSSGNALYLGGRRQELTDYRRGCFWMNGQGNVGVFSWKDSRGKDLAVKGNIATPDIWNDMALAIVGDELHGFMNGKRVIFAKSPHAPVKGRMFLNTWKGLSEFKDIQYMVLDEDPPKDYDSIATGTWQQVPVNEDLVSDVDGASLKTDAVELRTSLRLPQIQGTNVLLKCRVNQLEVPRSFGLTLRSDDTENKISHTDGNVCVTTWINNKNDVGLFSRRNGEHKNLTERNRAVKMSPWVEVVFAAIDDEIITYVSGKRVNSSKIPHPIVSGIGGVWVNRGVVQFKDFEFMVLDEESASVAPASTTTNPLAVHSAQNAINWADEDIQAGKIKAPDLSNLKPFWEDDFSTASKSGSEKGNGSIVIAPQDGKLNFDINKGTWYWMETLHKIPRKDSFAIRVVASAKSKGSGRHGWRLFLTDGKKKGVDLLLRMDGRLDFQSSYGGDSRKFDPIAHPAINPEHEPNELLVIYRSPRLEIYVNGVAVCSPITWESNLKRALVSIGLRGVTGAHAEFDSMTLWDTTEIPTIEERIAKQQLPAPIKSTSLAPAAPSVAAPTPEPSQLAELRDRTTRLNSKPSLDRGVAALREELMRFRLQHFGTPWACEASRLMSQLRWPVDEFDRSKIDAYELKSAGLGKKDNAPENLVKIVGDSKFKHWDTIWAVDYSPNGRHIATASYDKTAIIWNTITGQAEQTLTGFPEMVSDVKFSPDSRRLATCFFSTTSSSAVQIWNAQSGELEKTLEGGHQNSIRRLAWSHDGKKLVSVDKFWSDTPKTLQGKYRIVIWDVADGKVLKTIPQQSSVQAVAMHPREKWFATAGDSKVIEFWDLETGDPIPGEPLQGHTSRIYDLSFTRDGQSLASAGMDKSVRIWNVVTRSLTHTGIDHESAVKAVCFSKSSKELISASDDGTVKLWVPDSDGKLKSKDLLHNSDNTVGFQSVAIQPQSGQIAVAGSDAAVRFLDYPSLKINTVGASHEVRIHASRQSLNGAVIATIDRKGDICSWSVNDGELLAKIPGFYQSYTPRGIGLDPLGLIVADTRASETQSVRFYDTVTGKVAHPNYHKLYSLNAAFSPNGRLIAVASRDPDQIVIRNWKSGEQLAVIPQPKEPVLVMFSPDSSMLASSEWGYGGFRLWDAQSGEELGAYKAHPSGIESFDWSPDGKLMVTSDLHNGGTLKVWDMQSKEVLADLMTSKMQEEFGTARVPHFSPDGSMICALVGSPGIVHFWASDDLRPLGTMQLSANQVSISGVHPFFTPEGRHLVSVTRLGTLNYFRIPDSILANN